MGNTTRNPNAKTYTGKELTGYLVGLAGQNIIYNITSSALMYYFQSVIFLPAMAYSLIVAIARVWDAINDPMMGTIVDKTHSKWGKCKPYLLFVPAVVCIATILPFFNAQYSTALPTWQKILIVAWAGISYIFWGMSYTAGDIPIWGVVSLMTEDANDRAKALSLARIVANVGVIGMLVQFLAASFKGLFTDKGYNDSTALQYSFIMLAIIVTLFASALFQVAGFSVKEKVVQQTEKKPTMKQNFQTMWNCKPFRQLLISGVLRSPIQLLSTVALTLIMYFFFDNDAGRALKAEGSISLIINVVIVALGVFGGMIIASAVTPKLAEKYEKKSLYNFYSIVGAIPFGLLFVIYLIAGAKIKTEIVWAIIMGVAFFAASWSMGGLNVLQSIMIADCVDYEEYHNNNRPDGIFFSGQSFITKLGAGISTVISGVIYSIVHWSDDIIAATNQALADGTASFATDYKTFSTAMFFIVSIPPMIGLLLSAIPTIKYALPNKEHKRILAELVEKRREAENE